MGVSWQLGLQDPNVGCPGLIPGQGTRYHMLQLKIPHAETKIQSSQINITKLSFQKRQTNLGKTPEKNTKQTKKKTFFHQTSNYYFFCHRRNYYLSQALKVRDSRVPNHLFPCQHTRFCNFPAMSALFNPESGGCWAEDVPGRPAPFIVSQLLLTVCAPDTL